MINYQGHDHGSFDNNFENVVDGSSNLCHAPSHAPMSNGATSVAPRYSSAPGNQTSGLNQGSKNHFDPPIPNYRYLTEQTVAENPGIKSSGVDSLQQTLTDLFWPGWPVSLPSPTTVDVFVKAFFDIVPGLPRLLHRGRLLARLALPPTVTNFPHPSLIHAICCSVAGWVSGTAQESSLLAALSCDTPSTASLSDFRSRQIILTKQTIDAGLDSGAKLFDNLLSVIYYPGSMSRT